MSHDFFWRFMMSFSDSTLYSKLKVHISLIFLIDHWIFQKWFRNANLSEYEIKSYKLSVKKIFRKIRLLEQNPNVQAFQCKVQVTTIRYILLFIFESKAWHNM